MVLVLAHVIDSRCINDMSNTEIIHNAVYFILSSFLTMANVGFVNIAFIALQRQYYTISATSTLITPHKEKIDPKFHLFPSINLSCRSSVHAWMDLRIGLCDFGTKYQRRLFSIVQAFLATYFVFLVVMLLNFFKITNYAFSTYMNLLAIYDIGVILILLLLIFNYGAATNELFKEHKDIFLQLKRSLLFLIAHFDSIIVKENKIHGDILKAY